MSVRRTLRATGVVGSVLLLLVAAFQGVCSAAGDPAADPPQNPAALPAWWRLQLPARSAPPRKTAPVNIANERNALWERYVQERSRIELDVASGRISQEKAQALAEQANESRFAEARVRGAKIEGELEAIKKRAAEIRLQQAEEHRLRTGTKGKSRLSIKNTGTPLTDPTSRGIFGDQDLTFGSDADRAAFAQAAKERGYKVNGRLGEGYITIEELDVVAHGPSQVPKDPLHPQSRLETHYRASGHESFAARGSRFPYLKEGSAQWSGRDFLGAVADNLKKVEYDLGRDLDSLRGLKQEESIQNLAKGTMRAMEGSGKKMQALEAALTAAQKAGDSAEAAKIQGDMDFLKTLKELKSRMDPRAVGLVPVGASEKEAAAILKAFQERCLGQYHEAFQAGLQANRELIEAMDATIADLRKAGDTRKLSALMAERAAIIDGAAQSVQHLGASEEGVRLLAETVHGTRLLPFTDASGARFYRDAAGKIFSETDLRAAGAQIVDDARVSLGGKNGARVEFTHEGPLGDAPAAGKMSKFDRGMLYLQAVMAGLEGARAESEAAREEGRAPSTVLAVLRGWWAMTGIQQGYDTGAAASKQAIQEEFDRINDMIRRGEDPNLYWSRIRALAKGLGYAVGSLTGATGAFEGGYEFVALIKAAYEEMSGPPGSVDELVRARADQLLATLQNESRELETWLPELEELYPEVRDKVAEVEKAMAPVRDLLREFEHTREGVAEYDGLCTEDNLRQQEADILREKIPVTLKQAENAALRVYQDSGAICRGVGDASPVQGGPVAIPPKGLSEDWSAFQETNRRRGEAVDELTAQRRKLQVLIKAHNEAAPRLELLAMNHRPQQVVASLPDLLDEVGVAVDRAAEPLARLQVVADGLHARALGMKRRAEMLLQAKVYEETALELIVQADHIEDKIKAYPVAPLESAVASALRTGYEEFERLAASAENLQAVLDQSCVNVAELDAGDLEKKANAAATLFAQADRSYNDARGCAEKVLGSLSVPLAPVPGKAPPARTDLSRPSPAKAAKPWVYKEIKPPAYLYRYKREDQALVLWRGVFDRDSNGAFLIGDGTGGVYHQPADLYGPYNDEAALCAVLRGMGKDLMLYGNGPDLVRCPKEGAVAEATLAPLPVSVPGKGAVVGAPGKEGLLQLGVVKGSVQTVNSAGATAPAGSQSAIGPGTGIHTGSDGEASFKTRGGTTVVIGPNTKARMAEPEAGGKRQGMELLEGSIEVTHPAGAPGFDDVMIRSRDGTVIAEGTRYRVEKDASGTRVRVFEGKVHLTGSYIVKIYDSNVERGKPSPAQELALTAGECALLLGTSVPAPTTPAWLSTSSSPAAGHDAGGTGRGPNVPSWLATEDKPAPAAVFSPLAQHDPWNNPHVQQLMDRWIGQAIPASDTPGIRMRYNEWLQPLSQGARSTGPPEHPADWTRHRYLWENRMRYGSTNLCTLGEFLEASLSGRDTVGCAKNGGTAAATAASAPAWLAAPARSAAGTGPTTRRSDDLVESARADLARDAAPPKADPPRPALEKPRPVAKPTPVAPETRRRSDDIVVRKPPPQPPQFAGDWDCNLTHPDGRTATMSQRVLRDREGNYRLQGVGIQFPARYVDGNRIGFVIGDGTTGRDVVLDYEVNRNVAVGTERIEWYDGRIVTYAMRCARIGGPEGKH